MQPPAFYVFWLTSLPLCCDPDLPRLLQYHQRVVQGAGGLPDELLYGRVGYLFSLVFVNQKLGQHRIPLQYIQQVAL